MADTYLDRLNGWCRHQGQTLRAFWSQLVPKRTLPARVPIEPDGTALPVRRGAGVRKPSRFTRKTPPGLKDLRRSLSRVIVCWEDIRGNEEELKNCDYWLGTKLIGKSPLSLRKSSRVKHFVNTRIQAAERLNTLSQAHLAHQADLCTVVEAMETSYGGQHILTLNFDKSLREVTGVIRSKQAIDTQLAEQMLQLMTTRNRLLREEKARLNQNGWRWSVSTLKETEKELDANVSFLRIMAEAQKTTLEQRLLDLSENEVTRALVKRRREESGEE